MPPASGSARFGVVVPSQGPFGDPVAVRDVVQATESLGYESAWFGDRVAVPGYAAALIPPNWFDALTCCLVGMGATTTLRFGTDVLIAPLRNPVGLARQVATADQLSGGRLTLGLGVGYLRGELVAGGAPPYEERGPVTDEVLDVLRLALAADPDVPESFAGRWSHFEDLHFGPRPVQNPFPLWVGGNGLLAQQRAARLGTGWHPLFPTPEAYREGWQRITDLRGSADGFTFSYSCPEVAVGPRPARSEPAVSHVYDPSSLPADFRYAPPPPTTSEGRPRFIGTADEVIGDVATFIDAGVEHFVLRFWTTQPDMGVADVVARMETFATEVAVRFR